MEHFLYTDCPAGKRVDGEKGWGVRAISGGLQPKDLKPFPYSFLGCKFETSGETRLAFLLEGNQCCLLRSVENDTFRGPVCFTHGFVFCGDQKPSLGELITASWSDEWEKPDYSGDCSLLSRKRFPISSVGSDGNIQFLSSETNRNLTASLINAHIRIGSNGQIVIEADSETAAFAISVLAHVLPRKLTDQITFSTYESNPRTVPARIVGCPKVPRSLETGGNAVVRANEGPDPNQVGAQLIRRYVNGQSLSKWLRTVGEDEFSLSSSLSVFKAIYLPLELSESEMLSVIENKTIDTQQICSALMASQKNSLNFPDSISRAIGTSPDLFVELLQSGIDCSYLSNSIEPGNAEKLCSAVESSDLSRYPVTLISRVLQFDISIACLETRKCAATLVEHRELTKIIATRIVSKTCPVCFTSFPNVSKLIRRQLVDLFIESFSSVPHKAKPIYEALNMGFGGLEHGWTRVKEKLLGSGTIENAIKFLLESEKPKKLNSILPQFIEEISEEQTLRLLRTLEESTSECVFLQKAFEEYGASMLVNGIATRPRLIRCLEAIAVPESERVTVLSGIRELVESNQDLSNKLCQLIATKPHPRSKWANSIVNILLEDWLASPKPNFENKWKQVLDNPTLLSSNMQIKIANRFAKILDQFTPEDWSYLKEFICRNQPQMWSHTRDSVCPETSSLFHYFDLLERKRLSKINLLATESIFERLNIRVKKIVLFETLELLIDAHARSVDTSPEEVITTAIRIHNGQERDAITDVVEVILGRAERGDYCGFHLVPIIRHRLQRLGGPVFDEKTTKLREVVMTSKLSLDELSSSYGWDEILISDFLGSDSKCSGSTMKTKRTRWMSGWFSIFSKKG